MSSAQKAFDLTNCNALRGGLAEFEQGNLSVAISPSPQVQVVDPPGGGQRLATTGQLLHLVTPTANFFAVYCSPIKWPSDPSVMVFPAIITWEVWIGGRYMFDGKRLLQRKTVLQSLDDNRQGLLFSMAGPAFRQVLLTGRLSPLVGGQPQVGKVELYIDALVGMSGAVTSLRVFAGDMVG